MKKYFYLIFLSVLLWGCTETAPVFPEGDVIGYRPVYSTDVDLTISFEAVREVTNTGKIFRQGDVLLLNEVGEGVHFINNADPTNPVRLGFLSVKGSSDMSVKDNLLYVNQFTDIVVLDFSDLQNVREVGRQTNAFDISAFNQLSPPERGYFFECVDPSKGQVIDWQLTTINQPKCYR